jgi:hypothetical protein
MPRDQQEDEDHGGVDRGGDSIVLTRAIDGNERNAHEEQQERANQRAVPGISLTASETAHRPEV